jgi:tRNA threonylcarbamoyladenosine biosynthesis protein TsaE
MPGSYLTHSAEETVALGRKLAQEFSPPKLVLLTGDLGAGKTTLVKGIAEGFNAARGEDVTSPTFTLVHEYRGNDTVVYHIDLYRIETPRELATLAMDDLRSDNAVLLVEWGEKFDQIIRESDARIVITRTDNDGRSIRVDLPNPTR